MSYAGQTFRIPMNRGGFSYDQNVDLLDPVMMTVARNINLNEGGRRKRGGTAVVNQTVVSGAPRIMGGFDFRLAGTSYQVFMGQDGKLYKDTSTVLKTGMSTVNKASFDVFGTTLVVVDGDITPQTWDGSAGVTANLTGPAADWSAGDQPFQFLTHGKGASRRGWFLFGNAVYYSDVNDVNDVVGGGKITLDFGDASGPVGMIEWQDTIFVFGRTKTLIIDDVNEDTALWGYYGAPWEGGAAHWRLMCKAGNDIIVMAEDGDIYSAQAVQSAGDYQAASIAKPAFIQNYIRENFDLTKIEDFHCCYDRQLRAVKFFMVANGQTEVTHALTFFIDRPAIEAWTVHDGALDTSGYNASCSFMVRTAVGQYTMYTGDYQGFLWKLEQTNRNDGGLGYYGAVRIPNVNFDNPRVKKLFQRGWLLAKTQGNYDIQVQIWVDGEPQTGTTVSLSGGGGVLGSFVLGVDVLGGTEFIDRAFALKYRGKRTQMEFGNSGVDEDFFMSQLLIDHRILGAIQ